ncbi:MAG: acyl-CoA carboxylase subunit epsilon [Dermatophilaceae bacterium]
MTTSDTPTPHSENGIRVSGSGNHQDVAAILAVLAAGLDVDSATSDDVDRAARRGRGWASRGAALRRPQAPGPGAWQRSYRS